MPAAAQAPRPTVHTAPTGKPSSTSPSQSSSPPPHCSGPLGVQAALGRGLGVLLFQFGHQRRRLALRNVELCLTELDEAARVALVREHFKWLARSLLERALLWYASPERLKRLIHVEGDVHLAERSSRPVM